MIYANGYDTTAGRRQSHWKPPALPKLTFARDVAFDPTCTDPVKNLIARGDVGFLYGPSSAGKTFVAIDLAFAIALGNSHWCGHRLRQGAVLHVAFEGARGLRKRLLGAREAHGDPGNRYAAIEARGALAGETAEATAETITQSAKVLADTAEMPVSLIVIDTLSSAVPGAQENESAEMSAFVGRLKDIAAETGAAVLVIHHTGKDATRGMRGSVALYANADFVIELTEAKELATTKCREGKRGPFGAFDLDVVEIGIDDDGDAATSCVVRYRDAAPHAKTTATARLNASARNALDLLEGLYNDGHAREVSPDRIGGAAAPKCVRMLDWRKACREKELSATDPADPKKKEEAENKAFARATDALERANIIARHAGEVWLLNQATRGALGGGTSGTGGTGRPTRPTVGRGTGGTHPYRGVPLVPPGRPPEGGG
jgi:hypothetical protein